MRTRVEELGGRDTIGAELARLRAAHRARRLELVVAVLRSRGATGRHGLERAVRDFGRELEALRRLRP